MSHHVYEKKSVRAMIVVPSFPAVGFGSAEAPAFTGISTPSLKLALSRVQRSLTLKEHARSSPPSTVVLLGLRNDGQVRDVRDGRKGFSTKAICGQALKVIVLREFRGREALG